jgi:AcrR family transcriptional regulator
MDATENVSRVVKALQRGRLRLDQLTARGLGGFLGKTTSVVYHHYGSLDGFLFAVSQAGYVELGARLQELLDRGGALEDVGEAFVAFGLDAPGLYAVMFERRYDWALLRRAGVFEKKPLGLELWGRLIALLDASGSKQPEADARLLLAGLHGLVSLAATGRANVGALERTDREVALASARDLARRICPAARKEES